MRFWRAKVKETDMNLMFQGGGETPGVLIGGGEGPDSMVGGGEEPLAKVGGGEDPTIS
jgi:hypothetical protein